jgi:hypothetical protein
VIGWIRPRFPNRSPPETPAALARPASGSRDRERRLVTW